MNRQNVGTMERWKGVLVLLSIIPTFQLSAQEPFPTRPPAPARLRPVRFPPFREVALPNGMTLLLVENHEQPTVSISLSFRAGTAYDPAGKEGVAALVAELLTKGTPTRTADQIAAEIEGVGGSIGASAGDDFFTVSTDVLSDHADLAFTLLGDVIRRATFPGDELELARTRFLSSLEVEPRAKTSSPLRDGGCVRAARSSSSPVTSPCRGPGRSRPRRSPPGVAPRQRRPCSPPLRRSAARTSCSSIARARCNRTS